MILHHELRLTIDVISLYHSAGSFGVINSIRVVNGRFILSSERGEKTLPLLDYTRCILHVTELVLVAS